MRLFEAESEEVEPELPGGWRWPVAVGIWNGIGFAGLVAVVCRGVFAEPPAGSHGIRLIGMLLFAASIIARELVGRAPVPYRASSIGTMWLLDGMSAVLPLFFALAQSGSPAESMAWLLVAVIAAMVGRPSEDRALEPAVHHPVVHRPAAEKPPAVDAGSIDADAFVETTFEPLRLVQEEAAGDLVAGEADDDVVDGWARRRSPEGDSITGHSAVSFAPGERIVALHVPFLPPFDRLPDFDCEMESADGTDAAAKVTLLRTYGVRVEVRRSGSLEATGACRVEWVAHRPAETKAA